MIRSTPPTYSPVFGMTVTHRQTRTGPDTYTSVFYVSKFVCNFSFFPDVSYWIQRQNSTIFFFVSFGFQSTSFIIFIFVLKKNYLIFVRLLSLLIINFSTEKSSSYFPYSGSF